ncbi:MAG: phosphatase RsbU N-terminal domain-containing protein [Dehalococcoidia bacterium]
MDSSFEAIDGRYRAALGAYLRERNEASLYQASLLGREYVELGIGPDYYRAGEALVDSPTSLGPREIVAAASDGCNSCWT